MCAAHACRDAGHGDGCWDGAVLFVPRPQRDAVFSSVVQNVRRFARLLNCLASPLLSRRCVPDHLIIIYRRAVRVRRWRLQREGGCAVAVGAVVVHDRESGLHDLLCKKRGLDRPSSASKRLERLELQERPA